MAKMAGAKFDYRARVLAKRTCRVWLFGFREFTAKNSPKTVVFWSFACPRLAPTRAVSLLLSVDNPCRPPNKAKQSAFALTRAAAKSVGKLWTGQRGMEPSKLEDGKGRRGSHEGGGKGHNKRTAAWGRGTSVLRRSASLLAVGASLGRGGECRPG